METRIQLEADLLALLNLQPGWDGRRAPAPSPEAVAVVRRVLELANDLPETRVTPDVEGGVALYFFGGGRHPDGGWNRRGGILVSNDVEATVHLRDRTGGNGDSSVEEIPTDEDGLRGAVERVRSYVTGRASRSRR